MKASAFEFRYRFAILGIIFFVCFFLTGQQTQGHFGALWIQLTTWLSRVDGLSNDANSQILRILVWMLAIGAAVIRTWATAHIRTEVVHGGQVQTGSLVTSGPFGHLRNPLYLGAILLTLCFALIQTPTSAVLMLILVVVFQLRLAGRERQEMRSRYGEQYSAYERAVPGFVPRWRAYREGAVASPAWGQAFAGELWFWGFAAGVVYWSMTFDMGWFTRIMLIGFGAYFLLLAAKPR